MFGVELAWELPELVLTSAKIEIEKANRDGSNAVRIASVSYPTNNYLVSNLDIDDVSAYRVRMVDSYGNAGAWSNRVTAQPVTDPSPIIQQIEGAVTKSVLHQELSDFIDGTASTTQDLLQTAEVLKGVDTGLAADIGKVERATKTVDGRVDVVSGDVVSLKKNTEDADSKLRGQIGEVKKIADDTKAGTDALYSVSVIGTTEGGKQVVGGLSLGVKGQEATSEMLVQADKFVLVDSAHRRTIMTASDDAVTVDEDLVCEENVICEGVKSQTINTGGLESTGRISAITGNKDTYPLVLYTDIPGKPRRGDVSIGPILALRDRARKENCDFFLQLTSYIERFLGIHVWRQGEYDHLWRFHFDGHLYGPHWRYWVSEVDKFVPTDSLYQVGSINLLTVTSSRVALVGFNGIMSGASLYHGSFVITSNGSSYFKNSQTTMPGSWRKMGHGIPEGGKRDVAMYQRIA